MTITTFEETPLKRKLLLKMYQKKVNEAIEWNFGYWDHNNPSLDKWFNEVLRLRPIVEKEDPEWYEYYGRAIVND